MTPPLSPEEDAARDRRIAEGTRKRGAPEAETFPPVPDVEDGETPRSPHTTEAAEPET